MHSSGQAEGRPIAGRRCSVARARSFISRAGKRRATSREERARRPSLRPRPAAGLAEPFGAFGSRLVVVLAAPVPGASRAAQATMSALMASSQRAVFAQRPGARRCDLSELYSRPAEGRPRSTRPSLPAARVLAPAIECAAASRKARTTERHRRLRRKVRGRALAVPAGRIGPPCALGLGSPAFRCTAPRTPHAAGPAASRDAPLAMPCRTRLGRWPRPVSSRCRSSRAPPRGRAWQSSSRTTTSTHRCAAGATRSVRHTTQRRPPAAGRLTLPASKARAAAGM